MWGKTHGPVKEIERVVNPSIHAHRTQLETLTDSTFISTSLMLLRLLTIHAPA